MLDRNDKYILIKKLSDYIELKICKEASIFV